MSVFNSALDRIRRNRYRILIGVIIISLLALLGTVSLFGKILGLILKCFLG